MSRTVFPKKYILKYVEAEVTYGTLGASGNAYYRNVSLKDTFGRSDIIFVQGIYWTGGVAIPIMDSGGSNLSLVAYGSAPSTTGKTRVRGYYLE